MPARPQQRRGTQGQLARPAARRGTGKVATSTADEDTRKASMEGLWRELRAFDSQRKAVTAQTNESIERLLETISRTQEALRKGAEPASALRALSSEIEALAPRKAAGRAFRDLNASATRTAKVAEKVALGELESAVPAASLDRGVVLQAIVEQLLRDGRVAVARKLADEYAAVCATERGAQRARRRSACSPGQAAAPAAAAATATAGSRQQSASSSAMEDEDPQPLALTVDASSERQFAELHGILQSLRQRRVEPALQWLERNAARLPARELSSLSFDLHRLRYLQLLGLVASPDSEAGAEAKDSSSAVQAALAYAQRHLAPFANARLAEIQQLSGCLLFAREWERSPYADSGLVDPLQWTRVQHGFIALHCGMRGVPRDSPLMSTMRVAATSVPATLRFLSVVRTGAQQAGIQARISVEEGLPIDMNLSREFQYHSAFVCPVSKEPVSPSNPPVLLLCGHAIARESMERIVRSSRSGSQRFKCPTCPQEQTPVDTVTLHL
jgi:hypothetical protein